MSQLVGGPPNPTIDGAGPRKYRRRLSRRSEGWLYVAPMVVFIGIFFVWPLGLVVRMSGSQWKLLRGDQGWNFPDNFTSVADNDLLWPAVWFTLKYTVIVTVLLLGIALGLALLVQESSRWSNVMRTAYLVPGAVGLAAASLLFWALYSPVAGPVSPLLTKVGLSDQPISFLGSPTTALMSTVFVVLWKFAGFYMLILLVGLQAIPFDVFESARVDGASRWQIFRSITLPLLRPSLALTLILCITGSLLAFDQFYILTKGGPDNSTLTVVQLIYREAFQRLNLGTAAALSLLVLLVLLIVNTVQFRGLRSTDA